MMHVYCANAVHIKKKYRKIEKPKKMKLNEKFAVFLTLSYLTDAVVYRK